MVTRIRQLLDWQQLSPTQFADLIGVGRPVVSHILSERNKPSLEVVQRIIAAFPAVSLPWLLSGSGAMLTGSEMNNSTQAPVTAALSQTTPKEEATQFQSPAPSLPAPVVAPLKAEAARVSQVASPSFSTAVASSRPSASNYPPASPAATGPGPARFVASQPRLSVTAPPAVPAVAPQASLATAAPTGLAPQLESPITTYPTASPTVPATQPSAAASVASPSVAVPAVSLPQPSAAEGAALLPFLAEPGKAIRRIVIFYRDGSFADYQPEA